MFYKNIIIGFGKAGKTLAGALAKRGESVALFEKSDKMYGGTCINVGCIPSKSLVNSASAVPGEADFHTKSKLYSAAIAEKERLTSMLRAKNYDKLYSLENVKVYNAFASFVSDKQIKAVFPDGREEFFEADRIIINTGSFTFIPDIPGIEGNKHVYTSKTLMSESRLPEKLVIIGAGYIGMEFASMYSRFGSEVTVISDSREFLPREDSDISSAILSILAKQGVSFIMDADVKKIDGQNIEYELDSQIHSIQADAILIAAGRRPNTQGLGLENTGIELNGRGAVSVNEFRQTSVDNIYAAGDVNGAQQFTFISLDDYRIVLSAINSGSYKLSDRKNVPYSVFMDIPLARVGITESEAVKLNLPYRVLKMPAAAIPKAQVLRKTDGLLKVVINTETELILGASLLCAESYEMINLIKLAMDAGIKYNVLRDSIYTHPTMTEAFNDLFAL